MNERLTEFRAIVHGFRFRNRFDLLPDIRLPGGLVFDPGDVIVGLCGGMCYISLDYYHMHLPVPAVEDGEKLPADLRKALQRRQRESNSLEVLKKLLGWAMKPDGEVSRLTAWREFPRLRRRLDAGEPAVLLVVRTRGLQNPTLNHQVTAYGYRFDALTRRAEVLVYDPNTPGQERILNIDLASATRDWNLNFDGHEPLRGFFLQKYRPKLPPYFTGAIPDASGTG